MSDEDDYRRLEARGAELFQRWRSEHPEAARDWAAIRDHATAEDLDAWRVSYPEAVAGIGRTMLYSRDCVRKMRMTVPSWEPPEPPTS